MPTNATMTSAAYSAATNTAFGQKLSSGYATFPIAVLPTANQPFTVEARVSRTTAASGGTVAFGSFNTFWMGIGLTGSAGLAEFHYGINANRVDIIGGTSICDGAEHHIRVTSDPTSGVKLWVDGVLVGSSATPFAAANPAYSSVMGIGAYGGTGGGTVSANPWGGGVDEFAIFNTILNTEAFTPPTAPYTGAETGLVALYHLNGNGVDSSGAVAATALTLTGPASGTVGVANTVTVGLNGVKGTATTVNLSAANGTFNPTSVTVPASGTVTASYTPSSAGSKTLTATDAAGVLTAATLTQTVGVVANGFDQTKVLFSPLNWNIGTGSAKTINPGAYFRTLFGGTSIALSFDMTGILTPLPQIEYRVDQKAWIQVDLAATISPTMPSDTTTWSSHLIEVRFKAMTETQLRWSTQATAVSLIGITLDSGKSLSLPPSLALSIAGFGDSITEGCRTLRAAGTPDVVSHDAAQSWLCEVARRMGAEYGNIGFSAQGCLQGGAGGVPTFPNTWSLYYAGAPRSWASPPDFIFINEGTNDTGDITSPMTTVLNGMLAATPSTTKIIVMRPYKDSTHTTQLRAAIAACTTPSRCGFIDTAGFFTTANSSDSLHPYGIENLTSIGPKATVAIKSLLDGAAQPTLTARTVSIALASGSAQLAANLTGLRVAFHDESSPASFTVPRFQSSAETTDSAGVLTFVVNSTLAAGGTGHLTVLGASNIHFNGPVQVT